EVFIAALEARAAKNQDIAHIASVASFFVSRIDTLADSLIDEKLKLATDTGQKALLNGLKGKVAIANAKVTYKKYQEIFSGPRWNALKAKGAQTQRLLWASTSTKNKAYRDVIYVEELIGADTVDTIPPATFEAFRDHGRLRTSLTQNVEEAHDTMMTLAKVGISMKEVTDKLLDDGVSLFVSAFEKLLDAVDQHAKGTVAAKINQQTSTLPAEINAAVSASLKDWDRNGKVKKLWGRDASLWTGEDEGRWLGWLGITD